MFFEDILAKLEDDKIKDEHLCDCVSASTLLSLAGYGNYIMTENEIICIVAEGVAIFPYHINSDMEYYAYRILELEKAYVAERNDEEVKSLVEQYLKNLNQISQYL